MKLVNVRASVSGARNARRVTGGDAPRQPEQVARELAHGLQPFRILRGVLRTRTVHHRPVLRGDNRHVRDHRVLDQLIERRRRARAARRDNARAGLVCPAVGGIKQPVAKGRHRAGDPGIVHRGREHERIGRLHRVDGIVHQSAAHAAPGRTAAAAGHAAAHLLGTDGQNLHLGTGCAQHPLHFVQGGVCAAARMRAAVDHENFHRITSRAG